MHAECAECIMCMQGVRVITNQIAFKYVIRRAMGPFSPPHMPAQSIAGSSVESSGEALWTEPFRTKYLRMFCMYIMRM